MREPWKSWVDDRIENRRRDRLLRHLEALEVKSPVRVEAGNGEELLLFSSNDYLGLSGDPRVVDAVIETVKSHGLGPRGSPLVCGYTALHEELEKRIAEWKGTEAALLCPTGFSANLAVISSLADSDTTIFSDELNHASIIDGCTLARRRGAGLEVYPHGNTEVLGQMLGECPTERAVVVTDSVFSMDGDLAPLVELRALCERYGALFVIDEAHSSFVFGDKGRGLSNELGVDDAVDIHVGTLSKGAGGLGGFVATTEKIRTLLLNLGRSYIYSTAAPLSVVGGLLGSLDVVESDDGLRQKLWDRIDELGRLLGRKLESPIVPIVVGTEEAALKASAELRQRGIEVTPIRPPTVPAGTARLRITLSAAHSAADISRLAEALDELGL